MLKALFRATKPQSDLWKSKISSRHTMNTRVVFVEHSNKTPLNRLEIQRHSLFSLEPLAQRNVLFSLPRSIQRTHTPSICHPGQESFPRDRLTPQGNAPRDLMNAPDPGQRAWNIYLCPSADICTFMGCIKVYYCIYMDWYIHRRFRILPLKYK